jgi:adenosine kinase
MRATPFLLSGSFAYDTILHHAAPFEHSILPEAVAKLNVCFDIASVQEEFGGTGGNIAYNAALLQQSPVLVGSVGDDIQRYADWMVTLGLNVGTLTLAPNKPCAHAWITSDAQGNQLTAFSRGAMTTTPRVPAETPELWHLAPEYPVNMALLARQAIEQNKTFFFDPGQALPDFLAVPSMVDPILPLAELLRAAKGIFFNDYEAKLLIAATGQPLENWLTEPGQFFVRTRGGLGVLASILEPSGAIATYVCGVAPADAIVDPTGCGDAFRAGFLFGRTEGWSMEESLALGAVMGSFAIEAHGGQNHRPTHAAIWQRFADFTMREDFASCVTAAK